MAEGRSSPGLLQENEFQRGRPSTEVDAEEVQFLLSKGFTKSRIPDSGQGLTDSSGHCIAYSFRYAPGIHLSNHKSMWSFQRNTYVTKDTPNKQPFLR